MARDRTTLLGQCFFLKSSLDANNQKKCQGGTFLYVATVLQPGRSAADELSHRHRLILTVLGMVLPNLVIVLFGDMHH